MAILETLYDERWRILAALAVLYLARMLRVYSRLRHFKGPWGVGFSEFPHSRRLLSMQAYIWYEQVCAQYGQFGRTPCDWKGPS